MNSNPESRSVQRRLLSRQARDAFPPMGVYAIRDAATASITVGSSRDVHARLNRIRFELRLGTHPDTSLQATWRQNSANVTFDVLDMVKQRTDPAFDYAEELRLLEQLYREQLCGGGTR
jgi:hypothetical protein